MAKKTITVIAEIITEKHSLADHFSIKIASQVYKFTDVRVK